MQPPALDFVNNAMFDFKHKPDVFPSFHIVDVFVVMNPIGLSVNLLQHRSIHADFYTAHRGQIADLIQFDFLGDPIDKGNL